MVLSMDRWVGKVAVVTGASSGIGAAIAEALAKEGLKVAALARRKGRLEELAKKVSNQKGQIFAIQADIANETDILDAFTWIKNNLGPIHILINNAGVLPPSSGILDGQTESWEQLYKVNVIGLSICTREAVKYMKDNKVNGHIVHINSVLGHEVIKRPYMNVYPSSKFAVTALAETLRLELMNQKSQIKITSVSPGLTDTEFLIPIRKNPEYKKIIDEAKILEPQDIADAVVYVLSTPPHVQVQELTVRTVSQN
ncbi:hypothetical protein NQ315_003159 [Exocentrus adspersus]|uniref:Farnesol dehydrogenase-like n=1 Tax=Exocentrus adspersus TaxID=1586481 RepID=A0AAV8W5B6_9CUCU|nr:hypothetical protein NQ315_003159 [Exocentrus adspersus]